MLGGIQMEENKYMTVEETAEYLKMPKDTTYDLCKRKGFPAVKLGKQWRVHKDSLDAWFLQQANKVKMTL
jgi:excisionase family DNA binding protein